jgi:predicted nucleic acid-binding protein
MLLDSNIIIYTFHSNYPEVADFMKGKSFYASDISRLEVMGYHRLTKEGYQKFEEFFERIFIFEVTSRLIDHAIQLRRNQNMSLGDAIIAATALQFDMPLITNNTSDFKWVENLKTINPLATKR